jgi:hypothetical protein
LGKWLLGMSWSVLEGGQSPDNGRDIDKAEGEDNFAGRQAGKWLKMVVWQTQKCLTGKDDKMRFQLSRQQLICHVGRLQTS